jgi:hypothetical protein
MISMLLLLFAHTLAPSKHMTLENKKNALHYNRPAGESEAKIQQSSIK